jgi:hypothetical protein
LSFLYLMASWLVGMLLGRLQGEHAKDVAIAVLRHQLRVLRRRVKRPEFRPAVDLQGRPRPHDSTADSKLNAHNRVSGTHTYEATVDRPQLRVHFSVSS